MPAAPRAATIVETLTIAPPPRRAISGASAREALAAGFDRWFRAIRDALTRLVESRALRDDADVDRLALALLAAIQGGLLLAQTQHSTDALEAGLDTALDAVRAVATG